MKSMTLRTNLGIPSYKFINDGASVSDALQMETLATWMTVARRNKSK